MRPINLTEGAIAILTNGEAYLEDFKPVLQIADVRLVNPQNQNNNNERYRFLLSDGAFLQQAMLAMEKNYLIRSQQIQKGSIIQMNHFFCNSIQNRMIIVVIDMDILLKTCDTIGEPKHYLANGSSPSVPRPPAPLQPSTNQSGCLTDMISNNKGKSIRNKYDVVHNPPRGVNERLVEIHYRVIDIMESLENLTKQNQALMAKQERVERLAKAAVIGLGKDLTDLLTPPTSPGRDVQG